MRDWSGRRRHCLTASALLRFLEVLDDVDLGGAEPRQFDGEIGAQGGVEEIAELQLQRANVPFAELTTFVLCQGIESQLLGRQVLGPNYRNFVKPEFLGSQPTGMATHDPIVAVDEDGIVEPERSDRGRNRIHLPAAVLAQQARRRLEHCGINIADLQLQSVMQAISGVCVEPRVGGGGASRGTSATTYWLRCHHHSPCRKAATDSRANARDAVCSGCFHKA